LVIRGYKDRKEIKVLSACRVGKEFKVRRDSADIREFREIKACRVGRAI
jgi:hypothetical protein